MHALHILLFKIKCCQQCFLVGETDFLDRLSFEIIAWVILGLLQVDDAGVALLIEGDEVRIGHRDMVFFVITLRAVFSEQIPYHDGGLTWVLCRSKRDYNPVA